MFGGRVTLLCRRTKGAKSAMKETEREEEEINKHKELERTGEIYHIEASCFNQYD
jgi:hypothetical protein